MEHTKNSARMEVYRNTMLPQETKAITNNLTLHIKQLEEEEQTQPEVCRRKEIISIRAEIKEIEV